jgi:hypothetical protein
MGQEIIEGLGNTGILVNVSEVTKQGRYTSLGFVCTWMFWGSPGLHKNKFPRLRMDTTLGL